jgi:hypothetical protein
MLKIFDGVSIMFLISSSISGCQCFLAYSDRTRLMGRQGQRTYGISPKSWSHKAHTPYELPSWMVMEILDRQEKKQLLIQIPVAVPQRHLFDVGVRFLRIPLLYLVHTVAESKLIPYTLIFHKTKCSRVSVFIKECS